MRRYRQLNLSHEPTVKVKCGGCLKRQRQANRLVPGFGNALAKLADPIAELVGWKEKSILLTFTHGLGDYVQFTVVLGHLAREFPDWRVDVAARSEMHHMLRGAGARNVLQLEEPHGEYVYTVAVSWPEPDRCYPDTPSTKAERCLRELFAIRPRADLCRYHVAFDRQHVTAAARYMATLPNARGMVLLHYQGNSARRAKNLDESIARSVARTVCDCGYTPVVLDWDHRSRIVDNQAVHRAEIATDPATIAALAARAKLCIGIDSGPGHVFGSDTLGAPTLIAWRRHHPVHYYGLADHVTHVVPTNHEHYLRGDANRGREFFRHHYNHVVCERHLRYTLPDLVRERLS